MAGGLWLQPRDELKLGELYLCQPSSCRRARVSGVQRGNGGQIVMVIPDLDLGVGFNGGSYGEFLKWYRWGLQFVPAFIIPAATP